MQFWGAGAWVRRGRRGALRILFSSSSQTTTQKGNQPANDPEGGKRQSNQCKMNLTGTCDEKKLDEDQQVDGQHWEANQPADYLQNGEEDSIQLLFP